MSRRVLAGPYPAGYSISSATFEEWPSAVAHCQHYPDCCTPNIRFCYHIQLNLLAHILSTYAVTIVH